MRLLLILALLVALCGCTMYVDFHPFRSRAGGIVLKTEHDETSHGVEALDTATEAMARGAIQGLKGDI